MQRMLRYQEKHAGWAIFRTIYWSIFLLMLSVLLVSYQTFGFTLQTFLGITLFVFSLMLIVFGFTQALHYRLMRKIG
jgi:hypothetical protein